MKIINHIKQHKIMYVSILLVALFALFGTAFVLKNINRPVLTADNKMTNSFEYVKMLRNGEDVSQLKGVVKIGEQADSSSQKYYFAAKFDNFSHTTIPCHVTTSDEQVENIKFEIYLTTNFLSMTRHYQELVNFKFNFYDKTYDVNTKYYGYSVKDALDYKVLSSLGDSYEIYMPPVYSQEPPVITTDYILPGYEYFILATIKKSVQVNGMTYDGDYLYGELITHKDKGTDIG